MAAPGAGPPSTGPEREKPRYSRVEKLAIFLVLLVGGILAYSYFADIPLRQLFQLGESEDVSSAPIGTVTLVEGQVLRKRAKEVSFKNLVENSSVYPNDTVMTGPDSLCVIVLKNGRTIRITANSLVKLSYGADLSAGGISVDVLRGALGDDERAVPMKGTPLGPGGMPGPAHPGLVPLMILDTVPAGPTIYSFTEEEFARRRKPIKVTAKINRPADLAFELFFSEPTAHRRVKVALSTPEISKDLDASLTFEFDHPGHYEWEVLDEKRQVVVSIPLVLNPEVRAIRPLPALDVSDRLEGTASIKTFAGPTLRWAPLEGPGAYRVKLYRFGSKSPKILETLASELRVDPADMRLDRPLHYKVEKELPGGFLAVSDMLEQSFLLVAPSPVKPEPESHVASESLASSGDLVFFTWAKTNFTASYELQLDTRPAFSAPILVRAVKDNVLSLRTPAPGRYYWRVRSKVQDLWTPFSEVRSFIVDSPN